jgi:glyoxylase-like metal-dependent hydrolase (beta-lactamase superfamily II)
VNTNVGLKKIIEGAYLVPLGSANAALLDGGPELALVVWRPQEQMEPVRIDRYVADGETLPIAGGLHVVHIPGHCAGQVAFLWQGERLLIAGDVGMNILGLGDPLGFEDIKQGRRGQRKVARLRFHAAVFGHGRPIHSGASERIRSKWGR